MAFEGAQIRIPAALAAADLSSNQFYFVKKNTTNGQFALAATDGEIVVGVLQDKPSAAGAAACICAWGVTKIEAGGTLTAGDYVGTDSSGRAVKKNHTATGADVGDYICGYVIEGAASGEKATIMFGAPAYRVFVS